MSFIQCQSTSLDNPSTTSQAARCGNLKALNELINKGHPVDVMDNRGWMSLQEAAYENHVECLKLLLKQADTSVNHVSFDGRSALLLATEQGHYESMELLLAHNADPNLGDAMQTYPILEAVISTKLECVNLLLDAGAAVDKQNYCGTSALNHACSEGMCDIAKALLQAGASLTSLEDYNITPIFNAARYNQPECLTLLIEEAKERDELHALDMQASDGGTAVYIAAQEGHLECLQLLLKHGASANIPTNSQSALPLYAALKFAREGCVDLLLKVTDQSLFIRCHSSPIEHALYAENISILQKMMDSGIDPNFSHFSEYYCDYHSYSASPCLELSMLEFNKAIHPLALVFLLINNEVEEFLHLLYKAGSHCADLPPRGLSPLLTASHKCNLADYKSLVTRGKAKVNVYHKHALGNVVLLHAMVSYAKLFWLLQSGADCDSLFIPTHSRVGNYKATFLTTLNEIFNLHPAVDFVKSVLYIIVQSTSQRVKSLDSVDGVKEIVGEEMWNTANDIIESPRSLFHQTRICIRRSLGVEALIHREMLSTLKLPTALVDALLLRDLIHLTVGDPEKYLDEGF